MALVDLQIASTPDAAVEVVKLVVSTAGIPSPQPVGSSILDRESLLSSIRGALINYPDLVALIEQQFLSAWIAVAIAWRLRLGESA
jgi:hypothetical protein